MNQSIHSLLCILLFLCYFNNLKEVNSENALLFSLKEITRTLDINVTPCLTACPASTQQEKKFNDAVSISGECLFLRNVYTSEDSPENIRLNICDRPFKPVTIYNAKHDKYKIGYEVYFNEKINDQVKITSAYECHYDQYRSTNVYNHDNMTISTKPPNAFYIKYVDGSKTMFKLADGSATFVFYWIPVFSVDYATHKTRIVPTYNARVVDDNFTQNMQNISKDIWNITCDDYSIDEHLKELFSEKNQENCLKDIKTPSSQTETPSTVLSCGQSFGCLEKSQTIPLWYFRSRSTRLASCTRLNVIPVWNTIADGQLKKVDQHILSMLNFWRRYIKIENDRKFGDIIYGTTGVLKLPTKPTSGARFGDDEKLREVYLSNTHLNQTTKILVPKVIFRIVTVWWRGVAIIIHNNPGPIMEGDRMCSNATRVPGWEDIVNNDPTTGVTYTCSLTQELDYKLGANVFDHEKYMMLQGSQEQASRMLLSDYNKLNARQQTENPEKTFT